MIFMCEAEAVVQFAAASMSLLIEGIDVVLSSTGLLEIMKCVLSIGNIMNQGTRAGAAKAFQLGRLSKLQQTKSADGKSSLMDYLLNVSQSVSQLVCKSVSQ